MIFSIVNNLHEVFDFSCVVFNREYPAEQEFLKIGKIYRIKCYPFKGKRDYFELFTRPFKLYFGIKRICKNKHIDVIHCHNQRDEWICLLAAKHAKVPVRIAHSHVTNSPKKKNVIERFYKSLSPKLLSRVATVKIGCSAAACEQLYGTKDYMVIPNSVDFRRFSSSKREKHNGINFIHVGRFNYAKNQEFVLQTFAYINRLLSNVKLFLVGYGTESETLCLQNMIKQLGISHNAMIVPGDRVDVADYYAKSDYMIFPSRFEGFGTALLEAQAMDVSCYVSENVQPEADVGLLSFMCLSDGPEKWARRIVYDIISGNKKVRNNDLLLQYSDDAICDKYKSLYFNNKKHNY